LYNLEDGTMAKYDPLERFLAAQPGQDTTLAFAQIEQVIGAPLPPSARTYPMWWSNETGRERHVQAEAWLRSGWRVDEVQFREETVTFRRA
jgi:hypothetical protein